MGDALDLCSLAWGEQEGYVCISERDTRKKKGSRGYWVDTIYSWPADRNKIEQVLDRAQQSPKDVYWAPAVFSAPTRSRDSLLKSSMLWADLDEIDPDAIPKHLKPTAMWESSPGRFAALWQLTKPVKVDRQQELNQRLTYALGADRGGWDAAQVLRTPDTPNHKYPDKPRVQLLYQNGHVLNPSSLAQDLPKIEDMAGVTASNEEELPDAFLALKGVKLSSKVKQLLKARQTTGDRSERLWELECLLAEQGMTAEAIAAVVQQTVWNKFNGRHDEVRRLLTEARKAVEHAGVSPQPEVSPILEVLEDDEPSGPLRWDEFDKQHEAIRWLVDEVWGESEVGFISGVPKSYKSWLALDLAVSVATGGKFLDQFQCKKHNVLLIQEEDPKPVLQDRLVKIGAGKELIWVKQTGPHHIQYRYELPDELHIISNQGFQIDEEWLEQLETWIVEKDIRLVILDPLMMIAGAGFDEFKAFEFMSKVLKPLKRLRAKTGAAICIVHHHTKGSAEGGARAMYGSVALWAWEEAALHLDATGVGKVTAERFSKHAMLGPLLVEIGEIKEVWSPTLSTNIHADLYDLLSTMEAGATVDELSFKSGMSHDAVSRKLRELAKEGKAERAGTSSVGAGRPRAVWKRKG